MEKTLDKLIIDEASIFEEALSGLLHPLLSFTKTGELFARPAFLMLSSKEKILATMLGLKALVLIGRQENDEAGPTEIADLSGLPLGTVKRTVRELDDQKLIVSKDGKYRVPANKIHEVGNILRKAQNDEA